MKNHGKWLKKIRTCKNPNVCSITNCFCFGDFIGTVFTFTSEKLKRILVIPSAVEESNQWNAITEGKEIISANHQIGQAEILFAQIEDAEIQKQLDKLEATKTANKVENAKAEPQKDIITFEDFAKVDLRIGTI
jgi:methionyl-tRNA synthetase